MNPVIIIPTFVCGPEHAADKKVARSTWGSVDVFDHMTPLDRQGELSRCLSSLSALESPAPVVVLVVAEKGFEHEAQRKIRDEVSFFSDLEVTVVGIEEEQALHARMTAIGVGDHVAGVGLAGYGAMRNLGLVYAASMGYTEAIFIDDDEVIDDPAFVEKACYGLGMLTQRGVPILIKTGYYLDKKGDYHAVGKDKWYDRFWRQDRGFNEWIDSVMDGPRLTPSNTACGGCLALHREAYRRVSFDPWVTRGEDLDFLLNVRMYGSEVWFDHDWHATHLPPATSRNEARRFIQDTYRWFYESRKLEFSAAQIDLLVVQPSSLEPYPGPFLESSIGRNVALTSLLRALARSGQRITYLQAAFGARKAATEYAKRHCADYFAFQRQWPEVIALLEQDIALKGIFEAAAVKAFTAEEKQQMQMEFDRAVHAELMRREPEPLAVADQQGMVPDDAPAAAYAAGRATDAATRAPDASAAAGEQAAGVQAPVQSDGAADAGAVAEDAPGAAASGMADAGEAGHGRAAGRTADAPPRRDKAKSPFEDILRDYERRNPSANPSASKVASHDAHDAHDAQGTDQG